MKKQFSQKSTYGILTKQKQDLIANQKRLENELSLNKQAIEFTTDAIKSLEGTNDKTKN